MASKFHHGHHGLGQTFHHSGGGFDVCKTDAFQRLNSGFGGCTGPCCSNGKGGCNEKSDVRVVFSDPNGTGAMLMSRPAGDLKGVQLRTWQFWNAINVGQTIGFLFYAFLAVAALSEILQKDFMKTQTWYILGVVCCGWSCVVVTALYIFLVKFGPDTDHAPDHKHPFIQQMWMAVFIDSFMAALLTGFHHQHTEAVIDSFNNDRNTSAVSFDARILGAWYAVMAIIVAGFFVRLSHIIVTWERHANERFVSVISQVKGEF